MYKATVTVLGYPDGVTAVNLVEGQEYDFCPSFAEFFLTRGLIVEKQSKPLAEDKETKPLEPVAEKKTRKRTRKPKVEE